MILATTALGACVRRGTPEERAGLRMPWTATIEGCDPADGDYEAKHGRDATVHHRPEAVACGGPFVHGDAASLPVDPQYKGACSSDADCAAWRNGRCALTCDGLRRGQAVACVFDECMSDADCPSKSECKCGGAVGRGNYCVHGNCATDADCGDRLCSPSFSTHAGWYLGYVGNYCRTANDTCSNDAECTKDGKPGYCAWFAELGHWMCGYSSVVG